MIFSLISLNSFSISSTKEQIQSMRLYFGIFSRWLARTKNVTSYPYSLEDYMIPKVVLFWGSRSCLHGLPSNGNIFLLSGRLIHLFVWFWNWSLYFIGLGRGGGVVGVGELGCALLYKSLWMTQSNIFPYHFLRCILVLVREALF